MKRTLVFILTLMLFVSVVEAQKTELLPYGDFNSWVTRNIKESRVIGGNLKQCYAVGPNTTVDGDRPYVNAGGSPWASSNVMAKVCGVTKVSNAVFPDVRSGADRCAKLTTVMENCKALGIVDIDVLVAGTLFLGRMLEPVKSTSNPYSKMEMGIAFTKRPKALVYDYKLYIPDAGMVYSSGFGKKRTMAGRDKAEVFVYLQRRWEDAAGNLYAKRVGTGRELIGRSTSEWVKGHRLMVRYGDISGTPGYTASMGLIPESKSYYGRNSHGKMVPVREVGWDSSEATPTHLMVMFSSGSGEPYTGTPGATFWVDNVGLEY
ncbi:MAG: PCMD domain-containing protein [Muribaculaceae bacterium]|nr:PCMD domain-containing protein [Muribaculaceae bacterium]